MDNLTQARELIKKCKDTQNPYLDLGKCGITDLEEIPELFECTHLETLILSTKWLDGKNWRRSNNIGKDNRIFSIPGEISNLKKITNLFIGNLKVSDISFLANLTELRILDLRSNKISDISSLTNLTGLQFLDIRSNKISDVSALANLTRLQFLNIQFNKISDISALANLTGLQFLDLQINQISDISALVNLTELRNLDLGSNKISDITALANLTELQILDLGSNKISDISALVNLTELRTLDLRKNNLKKIPLFIFQLNMDINVHAWHWDNKGLCLNDNSIESPPLEIIKQGKQSVLAWFEATKEKLNEIKIILIGEPKAGKTSLLKKLKYDTFNEKEAQTDGVNIEDIAFGKCKTFKKQKTLHQITGLFWDFGGQEIMNATHQLFLTKRSVYVLVLDARKDKNNAAQIRDWVKRIRATGGDSPIIVLANQIDVNPGFGFENERKLQKEFPQIKYFITVSCKEDVRIDLFKNRLAELVPIAELFRTEIDERWITIKNKLQEETKQKYFLDESRFLEICREANLNEEWEQKNAIHFLHDLGYVLHFKDLNPYYYVLDPYWITYGAYQILTSKFASKNKGKINMEELEFVVNKEEDKKEIYQPENYKKIEYTVSQRKFLIDILEQFKLCFRVGNSHFIIPDLLEATEPSEIESMMLSDERIEFVYEYDPLPKSVMPNVMVERHRMIEHELMWRTGCVLQNDGCKALITNYLNRISLVVTGEHKKKREFMAIVRHTIDSINQNLSNKPIRLIPLPGIKDGYADYERLLTREKNGKHDYIHDEDMPTEKSFLISDLLEGITDEEEVRNKGILFQIREAIKEINAQQTTEITKEIMNWITTVVGLFNDEMDEKLKEMYDNLNKTDNLQTKLELSIPLLQLIGVNLKSEIDIKNWAKEMYKKHELKIFKLVGAV